MENVAEKSFKKQVNIWKKYKLEFIAFIDFFDSKCI